MIAYEDALAILRRSATVLPTIRIETAQALGRILANDFHAPLGLPRFNNSSMDGFAVRAADTNGASEASPLTLTVHRAIAAGDSAGVTPAEQAIEIMTGAAIPAGADGVIPIEDIEPIRNAEGHITQIRMTRPVPLHDNIRFAGEDFNAGDCLITANTRLHAAQIAVLFATGTTHIEVRDNPTISIFTTGKEVSDAYDQPLGPTQIYDSNTPYLTAELSAAGIESSYAGHIGDDEALFRRMLTEQQSARILISSGAVSKGKWDFIPTVLKEVGAEVLFHRVAIKPGKPVLFARLADGRYFFGLPGNPISTAIGLRFFIAPLLRRLMGLPDEAPQIARLTASYNKKGPLRLFLKARTQQDHEGTVRLDILPGQESFKIAPFLQTNAWAVFEETPATHSADDRVCYYPTSLIS